VVLGLAVLLEPRTEVAGRHRRAVLDEAPQRGMTKEFLSLPDPVAQPVDVTGIGEQAEVEDRIHGGVRTAQS